MNIMIVMFSLFACRYLAIYCLQYCLTLGVPDPRKVARRSSSFTIIKQKDYIPIPGKKLALFYSISY